MMSDPLFILHFDIRYDFLQTTLKELAASNELQEQSLLDAHERIEMLDKKNKVGEQALAQIRSILSTAQDITQDQSIR